MNLLTAEGRSATVSLQTVRSRSVVAYERLDAHFFVSPGVAAAERIALIEAAGLPVKRLADLASVWDPSRFTSEASLGPPSSLVVVVAYGSGWPRGGSEAALSPGVRSWATRSISTTCSTGT